MQQYSYDTNDFNIYIFIVLASCIPASILYFYHHSILKAIQTVFVVSPVFYYFFNEWCWRWRWLTKYKIIKVCDIRGEWKGYLRTSYDNFSKKYPIKVTINQSWKKINLQLDDGKLTSNLLFAKMEIKHPEKLKFRWVYHCEVKPEFIGQYKEHDGTGYLNMKQNPKTGLVDSMEGGYYTDEFDSLNPSNSHRFGTLKLIKK